MKIRGLRGAVTVEANTVEDILSRTRELLESMVERNKLEEDDIVSAVFSVTDDLDAVFPAKAAREMGWLHTPLMCTREIPVPDSLQACVRVLLHVYTVKAKEDLVHVYLYGARKLRPDCDPG